MIAIVTGGTRGIGYAILKRLVENNIKVAFTYLNSKEKAKEIEDQYRDQVIGVQGNENVIEAVIKKWGHIDILINNAGISYVNLLQDTPKEAISNVISTNLTNPLRLTRDAIPYLLSSPQPVIINISSIWGEKGASCEVVYGASKGGLNQLTTSLAKELGPSGVRVIGVAPGLINTEMTTSMDPDTINYCLEEIPLKKIGTPDEVANLVFYLIHNQYITGTTITIDGGYSL